MTFLYIWFGCGLFSAAMVVLQWIYEGCLVHDMDGDYYYLKGSVANFFGTLITGPIVLVIQIFAGMPVIPRKEQ